jgi:small subunit ribosomal protein S14
MARLMSIEKNKMRQRLVESKAKKRNELKETIKKKTTSFEDRMKAVHALAQKPRNSSSVRVRNRCELTGRSRGYYRYFKLSRIMLRELGNQGLIPGLLKASW